MTGKRPPKRPSQARQIRRKDSALLTDPTYLVFQAAIDTAGSDLPAKVRRKKVKDLLNQVVGTREAVTPYHRDMSFREQATLYGHSLLRNDAHRLFEDAPIRITKKRNTLVATVWMLIRGG